MRNCCPRGYVLLGRIGAGAFATVWRGVSNKTHQDVSIKIIQKKKIQDEIMVRNEINILQRLNHKNVMRLIEHQEDKYFHYIISDYYPNGTLADFLKRKGRLDEEDARKMFMQIASGLRYLHEDVQIAHRDMKLENIMLDKNNDPHIIDFGLSVEYCTANPILTQSCGSPSMYFFFFF